jgi:hypothetical protein
MRHHSRVAEVDPQEAKGIVRALLDQGPAPLTKATSRPLVASRVVSLERQSTHTVATARRAGHEVEYLGINPLFGEPRLYSGAQTDWVLAPATREADTIVPARERRILEQLSESGLRFPLIYIAHEVERHDNLIRDVGKDHVVLNPEEIDELVAVPPPAGSVELGDKLAGRTVRIAKGMRRGAVAAGTAVAGIAAAPVMLAGGAIAALATLDPIILGAVPAVSAASGEPAAWYVLAQWYW